MEQIQNQYVLVEGQELWEIDFNENTAVYTGQRITVDDLEVNGKTYKELEHGSIYEHIENLGYNIDEENSTETEVRFNKRTLIYLRDE